MALNAYTVLGTESDPLIHFYHEIVDPKHNAKKGKAFAGLHTQDYYEFSFFIAGRRSIKVGERVYDFKGGEVFLVSPEEAHGGGLTHGTLDRYRLHIWPRALAYFPEVRGLDGIFRREKYKGNRITLDEHQQERVYGLLQSIDNSIRLGHKSTRNITAFADILKLLVLLLDISEKREVRVAHTDKMLLDILAFIESSYDSVTVGEIEQHFGLSHATLWRLFSRELSLSPSAYMLDLRLGKAKVMLSQGFEVQTVSDECGFCDCSYFIKQFKKKFGITPKRMKMEKEML